MTPKLFNYLLVIAGLTNNPNKTLRDSLLAINRIKHSKRNV